MHLNGKLRLANSRRKLIRRGVDERTLAVAREAHFDGRHHRHPEEFRGVCVICDAVLVYRAKLQRQAEAAEALTALLGVTPAEQCVVQVVAVRNGGTRRCPNRGTYQVGDGPKRVCALHARSYDRPLGVTS